MTTITTQEESQQWMDTLEASIISHGVVPTRMGTSHSNAIIQAWLPTADGGSIELEYYTGNTARSKYYAGGTWYDDLGAALRGIITPTEEGPALSNDVDATANNQQGTAMKYIVTAPTSPDWQVLCGNLSTVGVEKMKARILKETGIQTEWAPCANPKGYSVTPADLLGLLTAQAQ